MSDGDDTGIAAHHELVTFHGWYTGKHYINRARREAAAGQSARPLVPHATEEQQQAITTEINEFYDSFPDGIIPWRALVEKTAEIKEKYGA